MPSHYISFTGWLADKGVDAAAWNGMSLGHQNSIKAVYEAEVPADQREYDLGSDYNNIDPNQGENDPAYQTYLNNGGTYNYTSWGNQGRPSASEKSRGVPPADAKGNFVGGGDGDKETFDLTAAIADYQQQIRDLSERKAAEAQRLSTRNIGHIGRGVQNALLATGRTGGEIEQLTAAGFEGSSRSLNDLLQEFSLLSQQAQAGAAQFGIVSNLKQDELNAYLLQLSQQQSQFAQTFEEKQRQYNQSQLQQQNQALYGGLGSLFGTVAGAGVGFLAGGPAGIVPGAAVGQGIFG